MASAARRTDQAGAECFPPARKAQPSTPQKGMGTKGSRTQYAAAMRRGGGVSFACARESQQLSQRNRLTLPPLQPCRRHNRRRAAANRHDTR